MTDECVRNYLPEQLNSIPRIISGKIYTHSLHGLSCVVKRFISNCYCKHCTIQSIYHLYVFSLKLWIWHILCRVLLTRIKSSINSHQITKPVYWKAPVMYIQAYWYYYKSNTTFLSIGAFSFSITSFGYLSIQPVTVYMCSLKSVNMWLGGMEI